MAMDKYYYIIAQLPLLAFDRPALMSIEAFLDEAKKWLSHKDFMFLSGIRYDYTRLEKRGPRAWRDYLRFEYRFREDIASWRQFQEKGEEYKPAAFPQSLVQEGNPLDVEKKLLKWRWQYIETIEKDHHFDLEYLVLYFLKLHILERLSLFDGEKGMEIFKNIIPAILESYQSEETEAVEEIQASSSAMEKSHSS
jgi:hypothetical protein